MWRFRATMSGTSQTATACFLALLFGSLIATDTAALTSACRNVCNYTPAQPEPTDCQQDCADGACQPQQADIRGELLVLALGSQGYAGDTLPYGERPGVCCHECQAAEFCNLWRWCSSPAGCGKPRECTKYVQSIRYSSLLPYQQFGPYNSNSCTPDGRWPYGMCSLMLVQGPANASYAPQGVSSGFVSGMIAAKLRSSAGCPVGVSSRTCSMCLATKNPAVCFTLVKQSYQFQPDVSVPASIAGVCANLSSSALVNTCMWCRTHDDDCLLNVLWGHADDPAGAEVAMKCVQAYRNGKISAMSACGTCPAVKSATLRAACLNCYNTTLGADSFWTNGCTRCFVDPSVSDPAGCSSCVMAASMSRSPGLMYYEDLVVAACSQCSHSAAMINSTSSARQAAVTSCHKCIGKEPSNMDYCTAATENWFSAASLALAPAYYKCLNGSQDRLDTFNGVACKACLQACGGKGLAAAATVALRVRLRRLVEVARCVERATAVWAQ